MSRLYDISYDNTKWDIRDYRDYGYKVVNKETFDSYILTGDIIGIEEINSNTFLIYKSIARDEWEISRLKLENNQIICEFEQNFRHYFTFISNDRILFDNKMVYSIKDNSEVEEFDWLKYKNIDVRYDENNGKFLYIKEAINQFYPKDYVIFAVDTKNFKPMTAAFSTLRNKLVSLTEEFTVNDLIEEDINYKEIIEDIDQSISNKIIEKGENEILTLAHEKIKSKR